MKRKRRNEKEDEETGGVQEKQEPHTQDMGNYNFDRYIEYSFNKL